jgi:fluoride exporter
MDYLAISIGAILGANARYLLGGWIRDRAGTGFPLGTLVINVTGSFVIGVVYALLEEQGAPDWVRPLVVIGFLGAYTTFSTFSLETLALAEEGAWVAAGANVLGSVALSLVAVWVGMLAGQAAGRG